MSDPFARGDLTFARIFILIGLALLALAAFGVARQSQHGGSVSTTGIVVRMQQVVTNPDPGIADNQRRWADCPVVRFTSVAGPEVEVRAATCASPPAYVVGERVAVSYDPDRPEQAAVGGFFTRHLLAVAAGGFAVPFLLIGLLVRRGARRRLRAAGA